MGGFGTIRYNSQKGLSPWLRERMVACLPTWKARIRHGLRCDFLSPPAETVALPISRRTGSKGISLFPNSNLDHGAVQGARRRCQYRAMRRLCSRARIRATYRAHATHILRPRPFRRGRLGRARPCPEESHLSHLIPPNPAHKLSCKTRYSARTTLRACATSHLIPLNPGESRQELSRARVGTRNRTATLAKTPGYATFGSTSFLSSAMDSYQAS